MTMHPIFDRSPAPGTGHVYPGPFAPQVVTLVRPANLPPMTDADFHLADTFTVAMRADPAAGIAQDVVLECRYRTAFGVNHDLDVLDISSGYMAANVIGVHSAYTFDGERETVYSALVDTDLYLNLSDVCVVLTRSTPFDPALPDADDMLVALAA